MAYGLPIRPRLSKLLMSVQSDSYYRVSWVAAFLHGVNVWTAGIPLQGAISKSRLDSSAAAHCDLPHVTGKKNSLPNPFNSCTYSAIHPPNVLVLHLVTGSNDLFIVPRDMKPISKERMHTMHMHINACIWAIADILFLLNNRGYPSTSPIECTRDRRTPNQSLILSAPKSQI